MEQDMVMAKEPVSTARADLVPILEELHDVPVQIDTQAVDRRYVGFCGHCRAAAGVHRPSRAAAHRRRICC
jgi:hypothetical protein